MSDQASIPATPRSSLGTVLLSSVKDEGVYLVEFIAHHRVLGFDGIYIASNDCSDGSDVLLATLACHGVIGHSDASVPPDGGAQHLGYARLREQFDLDRADWLMVLDADEFLSVSVAGHRVQDLTGAAGDAVDMIALNSMIFGDNPTNRASTDRGRVCERFTNRLETFHPLNSAVKSLTREPRRFQAIFNHNCRVWGMDGQMRVMRGDGSVFQFDAAPQKWPDLRNSSVETNPFDLAHYNHYSIKSAGEFALRRRRGLGIDTRDVPEDEKIRHTQTYFARRAAAATVFDDTILRRYGRAVEAEMSRLRSLPGVSEAEAACRSWYGRSVAALSGAAEPASQF